MVEREVGARISVMPFTRVELRDSRMSDEARSPMPKIRGVQEPDRNVETDGVERGFVRAAAQRLLVPRPRRGPISSPTRCVRCEIRSC